jgi:hypothetical protein
MRCDYCGANEQNYQQRCAARYSGGGRLSRMGLKFCGAQKIAEAIERTTRQGRGGAYDPSQFWTLDGDPARTEPPPTNPFLPGWGKK